MANNNQRHIEITFPKRLTDLYEWAIAEAPRRKMPLAWLGQEALECLRLFGSLEAAREAQKTIQQLQVLMAWGCYGIKTEDAKIALGVADIDTLNQLYITASEAGKKLAR